MEERPTRLTSSGPVGGPCRESLTGQAPPSDSEGSAPTADSKQETSVSDLTEEAKALLDDIDILIERLGDLSGSLSRLEEYLPGEASSQAARLRDRVETITDGLKELRGEIRSEGTVQTVHELLAEDYRDIAQSIAASAESLRSIGPSGGSSPGEALPSELATSKSSPTEPAPTNSVDTNPMEERSDQAGGTATALMFFGGAALTAWFLFKESGGSDEEDGEADGQGPGDVVPAEGALIGQY